VGGTARRGRLWQRCGWDKQTRVPVQCSVRAGDCFCPRSAALKSCRPAVNSDLRLFALRRRRRNPNGG